MQSQDWIGYLWTTVARRDFECRPSLFHMAHVAIVQPRNHFDLDNTSCSE